MTEPLIVGGPPAPARWVLHPPTDPWGDGYVASMHVELHDRELDAAAGVELSWPPDGSETDLVLFLQRLADDWRGWTGERRWPGDPDTHGVTRSTSGSRPTPRSCASTSPRAGTTCGGFTGVPHYPWSERFALGDRSGSGGIPGTRISVASAGMIRTE
jgi:hypothetical protein